jgi:hypothetical protein
MKSKIGSAFLIVMGMMVAAGLFVLAGHPDGVRAASSPPYMGGGFGAGAAGVGEFSLPQKGKPPGQQHWSGSDDRFVRSLYEGFLNRTPRGGEANGWRDKLKRGYSREDIVAEFMASDEYFVRSLYLGLLRREPDARGFDNFLRALQQGYSRQEIIWSIVYSPEYQNRVR